MSAKVAVAVLAAVLVVYFALVGWRGVMLLGSGEAVGIVLGASLLVLPLIGIWVLYREVSFGLASQRLGARLAAEGGLPVDDLPRRPSGRADREAAQAAFDRRRTEAELDPDNWRVWFRLGVAYDDAGDRRRARQAVRHAITLAEAEGPA